MTALAVHSCISGVDWPGLPTASGANLLALVYQLEKSEWWSTEQLERRQFRQLAALLTHAFETVPYYRSRLEGAGFRPGDPLTPEIWERIPVLRREDVQDNEEALKSRHLPEGHGATGVVRTSGSTGKPVTVTVSAMRQLFWNAFTLRFFLWHGTDLSGTYAAIRGLVHENAPYPDGKRAEVWAPWLAEVYSTGPAYGLSNIGTTIEQQADWLQRVKPDYLLTFPSLVLGLAEHFQPAESTLPGLKGIHTIGDVLRSDVRRTAREVFGVEIADMYSTQEVGYITLQCPKSEHHHVQAEGVFIEILDDDGAPCRPGEMGKVIATPLHNLAMPLIRYDVGDYAEFGEPCPCGRGLPVLRRIMGRSRNLLRLPSGERIFPYFHDGLFREIAPVRQFQVVQIHPQRFDVRLITERPLTRKEEEAIRALVQDRTSQSFEIKLSYHDVIARGPGGKYQDFICEI